MRVIPRNEPLIEPAERLLDVARQPGAQWRPLQRAIVLGQSLSSEHGRVAARSKVWRKVEDRNLIRLKGNSGDHLVTAPSRKSVQATAGSVGKRHPEAHRRVCAAARQRTFRSRLRSGGGKHVYLRGNAEVLK